MVGDSRPLRGRREIFFRGIQTRTVGPGALARLAALLRDESGQGTVEYILILSATVVASVAMAKTIIQSLDRGILKLGATLEQDLKTGRAPLDIWEN